MNLILRGHIRNSLDNDGLYRLLVDTVYNFPDTKIFIHSWSVVQSSLSWKRLVENKKEVTESSIMEYLRSVGGWVRKILIEDDNNVLVPGRSEGNVASTRCPIKGHKFMFYGMLKASEMVMEESNKDEKTIQIRFDVLRNHVRVDPRALLGFMAENLGGDERIKFMIGLGSRLEREMRFDRWKRYGAEYQPHWTKGVDNVFMASAKDMNAFLNHMYLNYDMVNEKFKQVRHQEWLAMFEAFDFFNQNALA